MKEKVTIIPKKGVGDILFGMNKKEIITLLGLPIKINDSEDKIYYPGYHINFYNGAFESILIKEPMNPIFNGMELMKLNLSEIFNFFKCNGYRLFFEDYCLVIGDTGIGFIFYMLNEDFDRLPNSIIVNRFFGIEMVEEDFTEVFVPNDVLDLIL